jgi:hypothetical protein
MDKLNDKNITRFGAAARKLLREATTESNLTIGVLLENAYHNLTRESERDAREEKNRE